MKRAKSITDILTQKFKTVAFTGDWLKAIGEPALSGAWIIWGDSTNGKTRFALILAKYISQFAKVAYNSLEEGISPSFRKALVESDMADVDNFIVLDGEDTNELRTRLSKQRSPQVIINDSIQYLGINYTEYKQLRKDFPNKLFIFISHADGKYPEGRVAKKVRYDAFVKIRIEGYMAFPQSRFGGGEAYTIWEQGAADYWNKVKKEEK